MDDLISRQAAIEAAKNLLKYHGKKTMTDQFIDYASTNAMEKIQTEGSLISFDDIKITTFVEGKSDVYGVNGNGVYLDVIRCKNCRHYVIHTLFGHRQGWCERLCDEYDKSLARGTEENDFCSRAEERKDG